MKTDVKKEETVANENRIFERLPCNFSIEVKNPFTYSFEKAKGYDFSAGGVGVVFKRSLPIGEDIDLKIKLSKEIAPILRTGRVVWSRQESSGQWRAGLHFPPFKLLKFIPQRKYPYSQTVSE